MTGAQPRGSYELRIDGLLGPVLLGAVPHAAAELEPRHTYLVTTADADLVGLLQLLVDSGVDVVSVRQVPGS